MTTHFVPTESIRQLTSGSFEHLASKIDEAILAATAKVFGESTPNKVERVGTFADHVIVAADDGRFVKVQFEQTASGAINILKAESVDVPVYTDDNVNKYLMQEARVLVESLLAHDLPQVESKLTSLLPFISEAQRIPEPPMTDNIIESVKSDRPWKRIYRERTEQIAAFLGADAKTIAEHQLPEKFAKLMTADTTADKAASYRELAISDLNSMAEAIGKLVTQIVEAGDLKAVCADTENEEDHAMVKTFSAFSEDLKDDLQNIQAAILESVKSTSSVSDLGKLYDTLALESCTYEMASRFVSTMSSKLRASK